MNEITKNLEKCLEKIQEKGIVVFPVCWESDADSLNEVGTDDFEAYLKTASNGGVKTIHFVKYEDEENENEISSFIFNFWLGGVKYTYTEGLAEVELTEEEQQAEMEESRKALEDRDKQLDDLALELTEDLVYKSATNDKIRLMAATEFLKKKNLLHLFPAFELRSYAEFIRHKKNVEAQTALE